MPARAGLASVTRPEGLGLAHLGFLELDPPALIDAAGRAGFATVSLRTRAAVPGGTEYPLRPGGTLSRRTLTHARGSGVGVLQVELVSLGSESGESSWRPVVEGGAAVGATRVVAVGDDPDDHLLADRLAGLCGIAAEHGVTVDLEFMPFRPLATLAQALRVVELAAQANARVMVDALHLFRSGGAVGDVACAPAASLGVLQLCDAPLATPCPEALAAEARERRLLPGEGELPLPALLEAAPDGSPLVAEVPVGPPGVALPPLERARQVHRATSALLAGTAAS